MPLVVLVLLDGPGDSVMGEKYDSAPRGSGDAWPEICAVWRAGGIIGNRGGAARAMPAAELVLPLVAERARKLVLEVVRDIVPGMATDPY